MKYLIFSVVFVSLFGLVSLGAAPGHSLEDPAVLIDHILFGTGYGLTMLALGCLGLLYRSDRFIGFMSVSTLLGIVIPLSQIVA